MEPEKNTVSEPISYHGRITDWPKDERPREKLLRHGAETLSNAELIAILLRTGSGKVTAVDLAKKILKDRPSLAALAARPIQEFMNQPGLKGAKAITLAAAFEIGRRIASHHDDNKLQVRSPEDVVKLFQPEMSNLKREIFRVLLLDSANHLLRYEDVTEGLLNSSQAHPREVFKPAIVEPAASIILMHNHPSGNPEPSIEDLQITKQMVEAGKIIGIPVHDHIIIAGKLHTSFAERGLL